VVSSLHRLYSGLAEAPCGWDMNSHTPWDIVCIDGARYSDRPGGRHGYVALFADGSRRILVASGWSAFVTRGLGVILGNPLYFTFLQGRAIIVRLTDTNGNGIWELGEEVELIHSVSSGSSGSQPARSLSLTPGGLPPILGRAPAVIGLCAMKPQTRVPGSFAKAVFEHPTVTSSLAATTF